MIAMGMGGATGATAKRLGGLGASIQGRPPTPEEAGQLKALSGRLKVLSKTSTTLIIITLILMAAGRYLP